MPACNSSFDRRRRPRLTGLRESGWVYTTRKPRAKMEFLDKHILWRAIAGIIVCGGLMPAADFDQAQAARFARMALDCVHKEYPNKIAHSLNSDADVKPPRELTPAFYGCYDWHSSVHGHWLLVRLVRLFPRGAVRGRGAARGWAEPDGGQHRAGGEVSERGRARGVRAAVWAGVAAATGGGAEGMGRSRRRASGPPRCGRWNRR